MNILKDMTVQMCMHVFDCTPYAIICVSVFLVMSMNHDYLINVLFMSSLFPLSWLFKCFKLSKSALDVCIIKKKTTQ